MTTSHFTRKHARHTIIGWAVSTTGQEALTSVDNGCWLMCKLFLFSAQRYCHLSGFTNLRVFLFCFENENGQLLKVGRKGGEREEQTRGQKEPPYWYPLPEVKFTKPSRISKPCFRHCPKCAWSESTGSKQLSQRLLPVHTCIQLHQHLIGSKQSKVNISNTVWAVWSNYVSWCINLCGDHRRRRTNLPDVKTFGT